MKHYGLEIHKLVDSICNDEKFNMQYMQYINLLVYKKCDTTNYSNYRGITLLSVSYKIISKTFTNVQVYTQPLSVKFPG
jgi:hypothetical protein